MITMLGIAIGLVIVAVCFVTPCLVRERREGDYLRKLKEEKGQGLVEYLLVLALVAFACIAGMHSLANAINSAFNTIGSVLGTYIK